MNSKFTMLTGRSEPRESLLFIHDLTGSVDLFRREMLSVLDQNYNMRSVIIMLIGTFNYPQNIYMVEQFCYHLTANMGDDSQYFFDKATNACKRLRSDIFDALDRFGAVNKNDTINPVPFVIEFVDFDTNTNVIKFKVSR